MPVFHTEPERVQGDRIAFSREETRHLRVRRLEVDDRIDVIDGTGSTYRVRLLAVTEEASGEILERFDTPPDGACRLTLAAAMIKGTRFDTVVEKVTELGVDVIQPLSTARTVVRGEGRIDRWERLARAAAKQSGRGAIPVIEPVRVLADAVERCAGHGSALLVADPAASETLEEAFDGAGQDVVLFIGPEGGFEASELASLREAGARPFAWGGRALRADTASIVFAALVLDRAKGV